MKKILYAILSLVATIAIVGLILAYLPRKSKTNHAGISHEGAASLRQKYTAPHHLITTTDGETLFLRYSR